ncbi:hypothetical protein [Kitasatospora griseola]|uniref:hypothetical protein n=1 Tax=Kitasatospora griseola TaxID=2064 RepID=UPI00166F906A|nr:hypothetical protein [Kitasatospora griseola]GGR01901.1 hypothetical protein GCM10010195_67060 [Kitasatospora griseola]
MATSQRVRLGEGSTWTVLADDFSVAGPVEQYLEYLRAADCSPNTIKTYAGCGTYFVTVTEVGQQK